LLSWRSPKRTTRGGHPRYADLAIETALMLGLVFGLRLRQGGLAGIGAAVDGTGSRRPRPYDAEPSGKHLAIA
jgi:hypothetical protein